MMREETLTIFTNAMMVMYPITSNCSDVTVVTQLKRSFRFSIHQRHGGAMHVPRSIQWTIRGRHIRDHD